MKRILLLLTLITLLFNFLLAQKPSIKPFAMTADKNKSLLGLTRGPSKSDWTWKNWWVTSGLPVVGAGTNVYMEADTAKGTWTVKKPDGSSGTIAPVVNPTCGNISISHCK